MSLNMVILTGHVGQDPVIRETVNAKVANFSLATSRCFKQQNGEKKEVTQWHNITAWRGLAEIIEKYVFKGNTVTVVGELTYEKYTDKNQIERIKAVIVASNINLLPSSNSSNNGSQNAPKQDSDDYSKPTNDDLPEDNDLPF